MKKNTLFFIGFLILLVFVLGYKQNIIDIGKGGSAKNNTEGTIDPSVVYCTELGYKSKVNVDKDGNQYSVCIFPDRNECDSWDFYRGKCGEEWSYCKKEGYNLRDMKSNEGWIKGVICIKEGKEIGSVYDLMNLGEGLKPSSKDNRTSSNKTNVSNEEPIVGMADPSIVYCTEIGYETKIKIDEHGNQYSVCIFPDRNECDSWDFYRGKCGEEWSYCKKEGYNLRDMKSNEGWIKGVICVPKDLAIASNDEKSLMQVMNSPAKEQTQGGSVYDLMNLSKKVVYSK
jgi:putative hemolysin